MAKLTAKFIVAETGAESLAVGTLVEKIPARRVVIIRLHGTDDVVFDMTKGDVFVMNEAGKTVATYRQVADPAGPHSDDTLAAKAYDGHIV